MVSPVLAAVKIVNSSARADMLDRPRSLVTKLGISSIDMAL
jgi:hypothetical protein